jgi:hypothetical protein
LISRWDFINPFAHQRAKQRRLRDALNLLIFKPDNL